MALNRIFESMIVGTGTGGSTQTVTIPYSAVTGNRCVGVLIGCARSIFSTYTTSATLDAVGMTKEIEATGALGGFGKGSSTIFYLAMGDLSGAAGSAVFTMSSTDGDVGRIATFIILEDCDQAAPVNDSNDFVFTASTTSGSVSVNTNATDHVLDGITWDSNNVGTTTPGPGQTTIDNQTNGSFNGDDCEQAVSEESGTGGSVAMSWGWQFAAPFALAAASFVESLAPAGPTITQVTPSGGAGAIVRPNDTAIAVSGANMAPAGVTEIWLAKTNVFGDATKVLQSISSILSSSLVWDDVNTGAIGLGVRFLFLVTDAGGGGEAISAGFMLLVTNKDVRHGRATHVTNGVASIQIAASGLGFEPKACFINITGNTSLDSPQSNISLSHAVVAVNQSAGVGCAVQESVSVRKRKQQVGTGSVFLQNPATAGSSDFFQATPTLTDDGLQLDFASNTSGFFIEMYFIGGRSVQAEVHDVTVSASPFSGVSFEPELLVGISSNLAGSTSDTTFARTCIGFSRGVGASDQHCIATDMDSATRNSACEDDIFMLQMTSTSFDWTMVITAFNANGFTWTGSNADSVFVLALNLDGAQTFMVQWLNVLSSPGSEDLPDSGIDNPGTLVLMNAGRTSAASSGALGVRWATGICFRDELQAGSTCLYLPETGAAVAQQHHSQSALVHNSAVTSSFEVRGVLTRLSRTPEINWTAIPVPSLRNNILMVEEIAGDDDSADVF